MPGTNEAFSRVRIDAQLRDQGWDVVNPNAVRFEYVLPDRTKADYVLCDRHGRALAVISSLNDFSTGVFCPGLTRLPIDTIIVIRYVDR